MGGGWPGRCVRAVSAGLAPSSAVGAGKGGREAGRGRQAGAAPQLVDIPPVASPTTLTRTLTQHDVGQLGGGPPRVAAGSAGWRQRRAQRGGGSQRGRCRRSPGGCAAGAVFRRRHAGGAGKGRVCHSLQGWVARYGGSKAANGGILATQKHWQEPCQSTPDQLQKGLCQERLLLTLGGACCPPRQLPRLPVRQARLRASGRRLQAQERPRRCESRGREAELPARKRSEKAAGRPPRKQAKAPG